MIVLTVITIVGTIAFIGLRNNQFEGAYLRFTDNTTMYIIGGLMAYILLFLLLGAAFMLLPLSREVAIPFLAILSLISALPSLAYYSPSVNQYYYFFISISLPFFALFWSLIRSVSPRRPIFRTNALFGLPGSLFLLHHHCGQFICGVHQ